MEKWDYIKIKNDFYVDIFFPILFFPLIPPSRCASFPFGRFSSQSNDESAHSLRFNMESVKIVN